MRISLFVLMILSFMFVSCGPDEVVKKYVCPTDKPYLNDVDMKCYSSKEAADAANEAKKPPVTPEPEKPAPAQEIPTDPIS